MWAYIYTALCWLVGSNEQDRAPRELVMAGPADVDPIRTIETATPDRCDGCGATAKVVWELDADEWRFCLHHSRRHATALYRLGFRSKRLTDA